MDIAAIVDRRNIALEMRAKTKLEALEELAGKLYESGMLSDRQGFLEDVLKREAEFSTGIGFGIAIPHAKSTYVKTAAVALGRLGRGVVYSAAADEELVDVLFMIAVPEQENNAHLKILQKLSRKIMDAAFRKQLRLASGSDEILEVLAKI